MNKANTKIDVSQFSNMPAVLAAMRSASQNLVPTPEPDRKAALARAASLLQDATFALMDAGLDTGGDSLVRRANALAVEATRARDAAR